MASFDKFVRIAFVERSSNEQDDIVDHIRIAVRQSVSPVFDEHSTTGSNDIRDIIQKLAQRLDGVTPKEVELVNEHLRRLVRDG